MKQNLPFIYEGLSYISSPIFLPRKYIFINSPLSSRKPFFLNCRKSALLINVMEVTTSEKFDSPTGVNSTFFLGNKPHPLDFLSCYKKVVAKVRPEIYACYWSLCKPIG